MLLNTSLIVYLAVSVARLRAAVLSYAAAHHVLDQRVVAVERKHAVTTRKG